VGHDLLIVGIAAAELFTQGQRFCGRAGAQQHRNQIALRL